MPIDPQIPLQVQPSPFNPVGAVQAGIQAQGEKQLQVARQQQIDAFPQIQEARELQLEGARYDNLVRQRNIAGTIAYTKALRLGMSDKDLVDYLTKEGLPEWGDMHLERRAKSQTAYDTMQRAALGLEQTHIATALSELEGIESSANPRVFYEGAVARLQHRFEDDPGIGNWTTQLPVQYPGPEGLKLLRDGLMSRTATIDKALKPSEVAGREAETRLHGAQADLASAEAGFYKQFGGGKLPAETAMALQTASKQLFGKDFGLLSDDERAKVFGAAKDLLMSPEQRQMLGLAAQSRAMSNMLTQMMLRQMGAGGPGAAPPVAISAERPDPANAASNKPVPEWGGLTPNQVFQSAMQSLATGQPPQQGFGGNPIRTMQARAIDSTAAAIAAASGMDRPAFAAFYKANAASLTAQTKAMDTVTQLLGTADRNSELLDKAMEKIPDLGSEVLNTPWREFDKKVFADKNMSSFQTYLRSVRNEYARVLTANANGGGSVLSDSARHETDELVSEGATVGQMGASLAALRAEGGNRVKSISDVVQDIQRRIQTGPTAATAGAGKTPTLDVSTLPRPIKEAFDAGKTIKSPDGKQWKKGPDGRPVLVP